MPVKSDTQKAVLNLHGRDWSSEEIAENKNLKLATVQKIIGEAYDQKLPLEAVVDVSKRDDGTPEPISKVRAEAGRKGGHARAAKLDPERVRVTPTYHGHAKHGTRTRYVAGCSCPECCEANTVYQQELKDRKRGKTVRQNGHASDNESLLIKIKVLEDRNKTLEDENKTLTEFFDRLRLRTHPNQPSATDVDSTTQRDIPWRGPLTVSLPTRQCTIDKISALKQVLARYPGTSQVHLRLISGDRTTTLELDASLRVTPSPTLMGDLKALLGPRCLRGHDTPLVARVATRSKCKRGSPFCSGDPCPHKAPAVDDELPAVRTGRYPWGAGPAPALNCEECGKQISKQRNHIITESGHLLCQTCFSPPQTGSRSVHAKYYPHCPIDWHDMYDHDHRTATRAAAWIIFNKPPDQ